MKGNRQHKCPNHYWCIWSFSHFPFMFHMFLLITIFYVFRHCFCTYSWILFSSRREFVFQHNAKQNTHYCRILRWSHELIFSPATHALNLYIDVFQILRLPSTLPFFAFNFLLSITGMLMGQNCQVGRDTELSLPLLFPRFLFHLSHILTVTESR